MDEVRRVIRASLGNRAKESLLVDFINQTDLDKIGDKASLTDGLFEVHKITHQSFFTRLVKLLRMTALFSQKVKKYSHYSFRVMQKEKAQLDGEVLSLPAGVRVTVSSVKTALKTIRR